VTIRDTLPREKLLVESIDVLTYKDIATKKGERKFFNKDFVFIGNLLNPSNLRLLI
jgi:hypothetical protein